MEKNQIVQLQITDISDEGLGIGRTKEGMAVFVKDSIPGDRIAARIVKSRKTYAFGRVEQIISASPARVCPKCPAARACGGCQIQEMSYEAQLKLKENKVRNNLLRLGGITCNVDPVIGMDKPFFYRNKSEYPIGRDKKGKLIAGFYAGRTHSVIDGRDCVIGIRENRPILEAVLAWMERYHIAEYDEKTGRGLIRNVMIRCGFAAGQIMVVVVANAGRLPHENELAESLRKLKLSAASGDKTGVKSEEASQLPRRIVSIVLNTNTDKTNVILGRKNRVLWGNDYVEDCIGSVKYRISPLSFYQVNPLQTKKLYETALSFAGLTGQETVWDLYCGIGTISLFLAQKAKMVCGVEVVPDAVANAKENAKLNGIENARFMLGKAEEVLPEEYKEHQVKADVIVVDPPRKGLDPAVIGTIASMEPERVVYVSCNSATLARDLKLFAEKGYAARKVQPVDMFPHSVHVETVVLMERH